MSEIANARVPRGSAARLPGKGDSFSGGHRRRSAAVAPGGALAASAQVDHDEQQDDAEGDEPY